MDGVNEFIVGKNGNMYLKKKRDVQCLDDPEFEAEIRYAKENGLAMPIAPELPKPVLRIARTLGIRNRSKSTSDVKVSSPARIRSTKAERKARNRAVSGCWGKKDGNRFEYGLDDWDELNEDYSTGDYDDAIADDTDEEEEYVDYVFKFDLEKVRGVLAEYFNNGSCRDTLGELNEYLQTNDTTTRVTKELITQSLDFDHCKVALGYRLMTELLHSEKITKKAIYLSFEEVLSELDVLIKDMPRVRENLTLMIAKAVDDKIYPRSVFDDITDKLNDNRLAVSCALEVYFYLNNRSLLNGKFESSGGSEMLAVLDEQMDRIVREFIISEDEAEVEMSLNELHVQHYNHKFVYLVGYYAINKMNENLMVKLAKLLKYLISTGCLLESCLKPGFKRLFKSLNDLYIDLPAAFSLCNLWVHKCEHFLDESIVHELPKPLGNRARTLSESDEKGRIIVLNEATENGV